MSKFVLLFAMSSILAGLAACNEAKKTSGGTQKGAETTVPAPQTGDAAKQDTAVEDDNGLYTGFDGATDYSLLVPGFRSYKADDPSAVKVDQISVKLSDAVVNELIAKEKEANPTFDEPRFRKIFGRDQKAYKITPLKAGKSTLTVTRDGGGGGGTWKKGDKITVYVSAYSAEAYNKGKERYARAGTGNKRACKSCHETGVAGAPPHELGRVMEISD